MASPRIIFLDIDGTLVDHAQHLPASAADAVHWARAAGNLVYVCTGRARSSIPPHVMEVGFDGVISAGGGYVESGGRLLLSRTMPAEDVRTLVSFFIAHDLEYTLQGFERVYPSRGILTRMEPTLLQVQSDADALRAAESTSGDGRAVQMLERVQRLNDVYAYRGQAPTEQIAKATYMGTGPEASAIVTAGLDDDRFHVITGTIPYLDTRAGEVGARGVDKGSAIHALLQHLGLDRGTSVAIGDSNNDIEMLRYAAVGIAMAGSVPAVLEAADEVTDTVEGDGIWNAFARHGLV